MRGKFIEFPHRYVVSLFVVDCLVSISVLLNPLGSMNFCFLCILHQYIFSLVHINDSKKLLSNMLTNRYFDNLYNRVSVDLHTALDYLGALVIISSYPKLAPSVSMDTLIFFYIHLRIYTERLD